MTKDGKILIVEDDPIIAMDLEDELTEHGYTCVWAHTVQKADEVLLSETVGFVILDMHLKSETTFDLAIRLQAQGIPFAFLSGNNESALPEDLKDSRLFAKPVLMGDVIEAIETMTQQ